MAVKSLVPLSVMAQVMALFESWMCLYPQGWASADFLITDLCCTERCPLNSKLSAAFGEIELEGVHFPCPTKIILLLWKVFSSVLGADMFIKEDMGFPRECISKTTYLVHGGNTFLRILVYENALVGTEISACCCSWLYKAICLCLGSFCMRVHRRRHPPGVPTL